MKGTDMTMKDCAFEAQDHYQEAKKELAQTGRCLKKLHKFELTSDQSGCVLKGEAIIKRLEARLAAAHVELQCLFVQLDEAMAKEGSLRR